MHIPPAVFALFGLVMGSFLNVCIYRIPRGESVAFPGSHCPRCGCSIRPYDNIPVLSFVLLGGKCRFCGAAISFQYPLVELMTGLAFYGCALQWQGTAPTYVNALFLSAVIVLVFVDYHHQILPNVLTLPGIAAGILLSPLQAPSLYRDAVSFSLASLLWSQDPQRILPWAGSLVGAIAGAVPLFLLGYFYEKLRKRQGMGMGDVKMMGMVGAFLGFRLAVTTIFAGSLLGSLVGVFLILFRRMSLQTKLAFGVFLGIGAAVSLFCGLPILHWYLSLFAPAPGSAR